MNVTKATRAAVCAIVPSADDFFVDAQQPPTLSFSVETGAEVTFDALAALSVALKSKSINIRSGGGTGYCETCAGTESTAIVIQQWSNVDEVTP